MLLEYRFVLYITLVAFVLAIIFVTTGLIRGDYWPELIVIVIGIVVGTGAYVAGCRELEGGCLARCFPA